MILAVTNAPTLPRLESSHFHLVISDQNVCVLKWVITRQLRLSPRTRGCLNMAVLLMGRDLPLLSTGGLMGWVRLKGEPSSL